jgi:hypothetical protein
MSEVIIAMIKIEKDLCIFYEGRKKDIKNKATNTDGSLIPVTINKMVPYRNLEEIRLSYGINDQDPYFFIQEKLPPGTIIYQKAGYWTP